MSKNKDEGPGMHRIWTRFCYPVTFLTSYDSGLGLRFLSPRKKETSYPRTG